MHLYKIGDKLKFTHENSEWLGKEHLDHTFEVEHLRDDKVTPDCSRCRFNDHNEVRIKCITCNKSRVGGSTLCEIRFTPLDQKSSVSSTTSTCTCPSIALLNGCGCGAFNKGKK